MPDDANQYNRVAGTIETAILGSSQSTPVHCLRVRLQGTAVNSVRTLPVCLHAYMRAIRIRIRIGIGVLLALVFLIARGRTNGKPGLGSPSTCSVWRWGSLRTSTITACSLYCTCIQCSPPPTAIARSPDTHVLLLLVDSGMCRGGQSRCRTASCVLCLDCRKVSLSAAWSQDACATWPMDAVPAWPLASPYTFPNLDLDLSLNREP